MILIITILLSLLFIPVDAVSQTTYYIDWVGGDDSNNGTSKETPWKRAPGMQGCLITDPNNNACRARTRATTAGDTLVFKGGVTWPAAALSFDWYFGNTTTFTVDATWYAGASWSRPVFDNEGVETTASPEGTTAMMRAYGNNNVVDNIEFKGAAQLHGGNNGYGFTMLSIGTSGRSGGEVKNCYFHGWSHGATTNDLWDGGPDAGLDVGDNSIIITSALIAEGPDMGLSIHDNVIDGFDSSPTPGDMANAYRGSAGHFFRNYIANVQNGLCCMLVGYVWGNTFVNIAVVADFDNDAHHQCYENEGGGGNTYIYNNLMISPAGGATIILYPAGNGQMYIFNNVVYGDVNQTIQIGTNRTTEGNTAAAYIWNNTFQGPSDGNRPNRISGPASAVFLHTMSVYNNLLIGHDTSLLGFGNTTNQTDTNNLQWSNSTATTNNYLSSSTYPYYPPAGGGTVDQGTSRAAFCATLTDNGPSTPTTDCLKDTTLGVAYNATAHTVSYPKRTAVNRVTWDIGAYEYTSGVKRTLFRR